MEARALVGLDRWSPQSLRRIGPRLVLLFFASVLPVLAAAGPAVDGLVNRNPEALLLAVVAVLAAIVTLLGGIVALVKSWVARMEPRIRQAEQSGNLEAPSLTARNAVAIAELTRDVGTLERLVGAQGEQIDQARRTSENNLKQILAAMAKYNADTMTAIGAVRREQQVLTARVTGLEGTPTTDLGEG